MQRICRRLSIAVLILTLTGCDFIGGADTLIRGSNNIIATDPSADVVALALAGFESVPEVTDADLIAIYSVIRTQALEGNLQAAQVMLRLAAIQREPAADATE